MMNLMHWRLLLEVAEIGNVSRAAEAYGITQSGASQAISQMEETLGVKLFVRDRRQTTLTDIGQEVLDRAKRMLSELESIQQLVNDSKGLQRGRVTIASFPSVFATRLGPILQHFRQRHPGLEVLTLEGTDEEVETWLASASIDIGVVMNPATERLALSLGRDSWVAVIPNSHSLARRSTASPIALEELVGQPFIVATGGCHLHSQTLAQSVGLELSDIRLQVRDWNTALALIREGMGLSIMPASTLPDHLQGVRVFPLAEPLYREFGLVCSLQGLQSRPAQALLEFIRKAMANSPEQA